MAADQRKYQERAKRILRAELKRKGLSYKDLADRLSAAGIEESDRNIANKISRGAFTAAFLLQCLDVAGVKSIEVGDD